MLDEYRVGISLIFYLGNCYEYRERKAKRMPRTTESVNLTGGGPANSTLTMSHYIFKTSFEYNSQFGYAAAMSYVIFILVAILSFIQMKVGDKR